MADQLRNSLNAANDSSSQVATLHIAIMAMCAYLLVTIFSTTPADLLIGRGIKLPIIDVEIPIVSFFTLAPMLVVIIHFNFLLQLQLMSRKLFAFDTLAGDDPDGLRVQLHGFPCTQFLVGNSRPIVRTCIGLVVVFTVLMLPLLTLIAFQIRFIAYQDDTVTWIHRICIWLDAGLSALMWPIIVTRDDSWQTFAKKRWQAIRDVPFEALWWVYAALLLFFTSVQTDSRRMLLGSICFGGAVMYIFVLRLARIVYPAPVERRKRFLTAAAVLALAAVAITWAWFVINDSVSDLDASLETLALGSVWLIPASSAAVAYLLIRSQKLRREERDASGKAATTYEGAVGLYFVVLLGLIVPFSVDIHSDGEKCGLLQGSDCSRFQRIAGPAWLRAIASPNDTVIYAPGMVIAGSAPSAEAGRILMDSAATSEDVSRVVRTVQPINLNGRSLRGGIFAGGAFPSATLRSAYLDHANLTHANLVGADLAYASLVMADLESARLTGTLPEFRARLSYVNARGADFTGLDLRSARMNRMRGDQAGFARSRLEGASLVGGEFVTARFTGAMLAGADLRSVRLDNAELENADLSGANLSGASLRGAYLGGARFNEAILHAVDMRNADLSGASFMLAKVDAIDLRGATHTFEALTGAIVGACLVETKVSLPCSEIFSADEIAEFRKRVAARWQELLCHEKAPHSVLYGIGSQLQAGLAEEWPDAWATLREVYRECPEFFVGDHGYHKNEYLLREGQYFIVPDSED